MFCKNCGTALPDGAQFCGACGTAQTAPAAPAPVAEVPAPVAAPAPVAEASVQPAPVVEAPAQPAFADPFAPAEPVAPKAKKKGKGLLIAGISVVAAAAVFLVCIAGPLWFGWFPNTKLAKQVTKWFGSDEAYMSAVEAETVDTLSNSISKGYGTAINTFKDVLAGNKYASTTITLEVGDTIKDMIESAILGTTADGSAPEGTASNAVSTLLPLLDGASITVSGGVADDVYKVAMGLGLGGEEILAYDVIIDLLNLKGYMAIPTLSDTYMEISQMFAGVNTEDMAAVSQATALLEALPSEEVVNKLLKKYIQLALDQFTDVSKESDTIKVGGIEEKVTVLNTKIGQDDLMKAGEAVLKELKKDSDVKKILIGLGDAMGAMNGQEGYGQQLYDSFVNGLGMADSVKQEVAAVQARGTGTAFDNETVLEDDYDYDEEYDYEDDYDYEELDSYILLTNYVNNNHEIIGRKVSMCYGSEKQEMLYYATATKGKDFAFELEVSGMEVLTGKGTNQKGIINGTYKVEINNQGEPMEIASIKVENFDSNGFKANCLKGTFTITPNAELLQDVIDNAGLPSEVTSALSLLDCSLKLEADVAADGNGYYKVSVCNGSKTLLGVRMDMKITDEEVSVPNPDKVIDIENIDQWVDTVDLSKLINSLKKLGLPEEMFTGMDTPEAQEAFKEAFKEAFQQGFDSGFGGSSSAPDINWGTEDDWNDVPAEDKWNDAPAEDDWNDNITDDPADAWDDNYDGGIGMEDFYGEDVVTELDTDGDGIVDGLDTDGDGIADYYVDADGYVYATPVDEF